MLQTVFRIPHEVAGWPVFGFGWVLAALVVLAVVVLVTPAMRRDAKSLLPVLLLVGVVVIYVLPFLEERDPLDEPLGLAIRGYGVMMLMGVVSGLGLTLYRAPRMGFDPDSVMSLLFWMFVCGIVGARVFFVIQYWDELHDPGSSVGATMSKVLKYNEGGLVVYGAVIGGLAAAFGFCKFRRLSLFRVGDLIAPGMVIGLALGRVGCLLNGCCHGGACEDELFAITFPQATHPYMQQLKSGRLLGMRLERGDDSLRVAEVDPQGMAAQHGVVVGARVLQIPTGQDMQHAARMDDGRPLLVIERPGASTAKWSVAQLPSRSLPTRPAQIYSAINALLLCLLLVAYHPYRRRDGELFVLMLTVYPLTRFLLELIRIDEPGKWGTALTISQWASLGLLLGAILMWWSLLRRPLRIELTADA